MDTRDEKQLGQGQRHPYQKPGLEVLDLATDEVLSVGCKTSSSGTAVGGATCVANSCAAPGS